MWFPVDKGLRGLATEKNMMTFLKIRVKFTIQRRYLCPFFPASHVRNKVRSKTDHKKRSVVDTLLFGMCPCGFRGKEKLQISHT